MGDNSRTQWMKQSPLRHLAAVALALLILLCCCTRGARGQQRPTLTLEPYTYGSGATARQNVCALQDRIDSGELRLRDALSGLNLTVWLVADDRYFNLDERTGAIDRADPGLIGVLLDRLAERAGFEWRNSFGVIDSVVLPENRTYDDLLRWSVWAYDLSAAYWQKSVLRMGMGASFPEGWVDGRVIMVGVQRQRGDFDAALDLWSFLEPFSWQVWVMIVVTVALSGLVYWFLDWWDNEADDMNLEKDPANNLFLAAISFTGHFEFRPRSNPARLFTFSLAFWALIVMSAYTANLASYLVVQNTPSVDIETVGDAVRENYQICVLGTSDTDVTLTRSYYGARIVRMRREEETFEGAVNGTCDVALTTVSSWNEFRRNRDYNGDCNLAWIGRAFKEGEGGFATKSDSGKRCTSLIRDVLNVHLLEMKASGIVGDAWENHLKKHATIDCGAGVEAAGEGDESGQLSLQAMGGTFIIHYIMTGLAIFISIAWKFNIERKRNPCSRNDTMNKSKSTGGSGSNNGFSNEPGLQSSANVRRRYDELFEKQNEKLTEMIATIEAMRNESNAVRDMVILSDS